MILITGSEGTLGQPLVKALEKDNDIMCCDLYHTHKDNYERCDIREFRQINNLIKRCKPDFIYHLAAEFGRHNGEQYYEQLWSTNVIGTRHILELACHYKIKIIFASSSEIYGELNKDYFNEDDKAALHTNDYAVTKWVNEDQIRRFIQYKKLEVMTLRFFNAYGPGEYYNTYRSVISLFIYRILKNLPITVYKNYHRVFQYIDDFILTLSQAHKYFVVETINVGGSEYRPVEDVVHIIEKITGLKANANYLSKEAANVVNKRPNINKAKKLLKHNPITPLEIGLEKTIAWMRKTYGL